MLGAMAAYVAEGGTGAFAPMNANFGIVEPLPERVKGGKVARYEVYAARALETADAIAEAVRKQDETKGAEQNDGANE